MKKNILVGGFFVLVFFLVFFLFFDCLVNGRNLVLSINGCNILGIFILFGVW